MAATSGVSTTTLPRRLRAGGWLASRELLPYLLLAPSVLMMLAVIAYPMVKGFLFGFTDSTMLKPGEFVGLDNYARLLASPDFHHALWFSFVFAVFNVIGCYLLGLGLALLMNEDVPGRGFFRVALLLPWIVPSIVSIVSWRWLIADQNALFNQIIKAFGGSPIFFLSDAGWAITVVILIKIWRSFPFMMLSLLAGLQGIDRTLYEAAAIDGCSRWKAFLHITMPHLKNISIVLCLLMTIWTVNDFDTPWLLTQGGPANSTENLVLLAYRYTFGRNNVGMGSAVSFTTLVILMVLIVCTLRAQRER